MSDFPLFVVAGVVMIGVLVIVHEAGHYVVARLFKVGTPVFSIGMGPRIFGFRFWDTDFRISLLPIGGYVRMSGADAFGEEDAEGWANPEEDFMRKPVWQRLLIMLAGPAANLILPFLLFTGIYMLGMPMPDSVVGVVRPGSVAEQAGIRSGDEIVAVAGSEVSKWKELLRELDDHEGQAVAVELERSGRRLTVDVPAGAIPGNWTEVEDALGISHRPLSSAVGVSYKGSPAWQAGVRPGDLVDKVDGEEVRTFDELSAALTPGQDHEVELRRLVKPADADEKVEKSFTYTLRASDWAPPGDDPITTPWGLHPLEVSVGEVIEGSAADAAGVQRGDRLYAIDGTPIRSWKDVVGLVAVTVENEDVARAERSSGCGGGEPDEIYGRPLQLDVIRDGTPKSLEFRPRIQRLVANGEVLFRPVMGVRAFGYTEVSGNQEPAYFSVTKAVPLAVSEGVSVIQSTLSVLGKLLRGELKAKESLGGPIEIVRTAGYAAKAGVFRFVQWMGMISFSLGIINLLPVPVLDGGQILFYTIEGIRGRPLPLALRERVQMVGVLFLAALMVMVLVNDIGRWLEG